MEKRIKLEECIEKFTTLLYKSDERIDRANEMVCKLSDAISQLTHVYLSQIDKLQKERDKLIEENIKLAQIIANSREDYVTLDKKYDILVERIISKNNSSSENNINVH